MGGYNNSTLVGETLTLSGKGKKDSQGFIYAITQIDITFRDAITYTSLSAIINSLTMQCQAAAPYSTDFYIRLGDSINTSNSFLLWTTNTSSISPFYAPTTINNSAVYSGTSNKFNISFAGAGNAVSSVPVFTGSVLLSNITICGNPLTLV